MHTMTPEEYRRFMTETPRTLKVATTNASGAPHIAPVWFALDGEMIVFTTGVTSAKGRHLRRDPRVSCCVDDERPPFANVIIEGRATLSEDPADLLRWATAIAGRYMGADRAEAFGRNSAVPGEMVVRVTPEKIQAHAGITE